LLFVDAFDVVQLCAVVNHGTAPVRAHRRDNKRSFQGVTTEWPGELPRDAETILHQHAIQGDITDVQRHMCRWIAYSKKHLERTLTHRLLLTITEQLESVWRPTSLTRDESDMLREAFTLFINHCFKQLAKIRELFPAGHRLAMERLGQLLAYGRTRQIRRSIVRSFVRSLQNRR
jgi:hypothetical protein